MREDTDSRLTELPLHLRSVVEELNRYVRDYGLDEDVSSKNDYYSWIKEAADDPDSYFLCDEERLPALRHGRRRERRRGLLRRRQ